MQWGGGSRCSPMLHVKCNGCSQRQTTFNVSRSTSTPWERGKEGVTTRFAHRLCENCEGGSSPSPPPTWEMQHEAWRRARRDGGKRMKDKTPDGSAGHALQTTVEPCCLRSNFLLGVQGQERHASPSWGTGCYGQMTKHFGAAQRSRVPFNDHCRCSGRQTAKRRFGDRSGV